MQQEQDEQGQHIQTVNMNPSENREIGPVMTTKEGIPKTGMHEDLYLRVQGEYLKKKPKYLEVHYRDTPPPARILAGCHLFPTKIIDSP